MIKYRVVREKRQRKRVKPLPQATPGLAVGFYLSTGSRYIGDDPGILGMTQVYWG